MRVMLTQIAYGASRSGDESFKVSVTTWRRRCWHHIVRDGQRCCFELGNSDVSRRRGGSPSAAPGHRRHEESEPNAALPTKLRG